MTSRIAYLTPGSVYITLPDRKSAVNSVIHLRWSTMLYNKMQRVSVIISIVHKYQRLVALCLLASCNSYASDSKPLGTTKLQSYAKCTYNTQR